VSRPDILVVSLGTTRGLRVADAAFLQQLRAAGAATAASLVGIGALDRIRRGYPLNDLVEAAAARRAIRAAVARHDPRAVVFSTVTVSLLAPELDVPYAVRFDSPAALNRPGLRNTLVRALERRGLAGARVLLPSSRAARDALPPVRAPAVVVPPEVLPSGPPASAREPLAVAYVSDPKAKGLGLLCGAWGQAALDGARLSLFGIEHERAVAHLERLAIPEPTGIDWMGMASAADFRSALRRCRAFVSAARWEDFGQAPLEALADGALLVTAPAGGAYEGLVLARSLAPELVAPAHDPAALASCMRAAFAMTDERAAAYRAAAAEQLEAFRPDVLVRILREQVLPVLLDEA
jgi:glycosyltransferase involved in cell wall biosynthesis